MTHLDSFSSSLPKQDERPASRISGEKLILLLVSLVLRMVAGIQYKT